MKRLFTILAAIVCTLTLYSQGVSFAWQGLSMVYPSSYQITDKEFDGEMYSFCCKTRNNDISMIHFSFLKNDVFKSLNKEDAIEVAKEGIEKAVGELRNSFSKTSIGETKIDRNHRYTYVYRTFVGEIMGTYIYGKTIILTSGDKYVCMILHAESTSLLKELNEIVNSIRLE
jgi:hypothetical protein